MRLGESAGLTPFPSDGGGADMKCLTEIAITDRRSAELDKMGLMPLVYRGKNLRMLAAFIGASSRVWSRKSTTIRRRPRIPESLGAAP